MIEAQALIAIGLSALVTYALRLGGLLAAAKLPRRGRFRRGMNALPGALMVSVVVPSLAAEGVWGLAAAAVTGFAALRTRNLLIAMLLGVAVIFAKRRLGL